MYPSLHFQIQVKEDGGWFHGAIEIHNGRVDYRALVGKWQPKDKRGNVDHKRYLSSIDVHLKDLVALLRLFQPSENKKRKLSCLHFHEDEK